MRSMLFRVIVGTVAAAFVPAASAQAQIGIGGRFSLVRGDVSSDAGAERYSGGQLRASLSKRTAVELSLDLRTQTNESLTERTRDYPLQASLLLFPIRSTFSPYVLGGVGWYTHRVDQMAANEVVASQSSRKVGSHAGFGAELRMGRHAALHADYRYTFLRFGSQNLIESDTIAGAIARSHGATPSSDSRFLPSYQGSMWTAGMTVYF